MRQDIYSDLDNANAKIENANYVSGDGLISLRGNGNRSGKAEGTFQGPAGQYDVKVGVYDEDDGQASASVTVNGDTKFFRLSQDLDGNRATATTATTRITHKSIQLEKGDSFGIRGTQDKSEFARFDYIEFIPVGNSSPASPPTPDPNPVPSPTPAPDPVLSPTPRFDPSYPVMRELATAGVEGGHT